LHSCRDKTAKSFPSPLFYPKSSPKRGVSRHLAKLALLELTYLQNCNADFNQILHSDKDQHVCKHIGKEEEYLYSAILVRAHTLKALRHGSHSFTCRQHHNACLSFVSVHQMAPPQLRQQTSNCSFTSHLSTPKG